MRTFRSGDVTLGYEDRAGEEPALLLLSGWCATRAAFDDLAPRLSPKHRTLAMDWRGHGASGVARGDFGFVEQVEDALAVIADSGARQVIPVATAHAGWVAIELRRRLKAGSLGGRHADGASGATAIGLVKADRAVVVGVARTIEGRKRRRSAAAHDARVRSSIDTGVGLTGIGDVAIRG